MSPGYPAPVVRDLGADQPYAAVWQAMRSHCATRHAGSADELWWLQHAPVYTQGKAGRDEHLREPLPAPLVHSDRGGQVTWHGPGQLVIYTLLDLHRLALTARGAVSLLETAVISALATAGIAAEPRANAPGVYVDGAKVASLGLRVSRGCCYHGLALNVDCDLAAFAAIDPCGQRGLAVTRTCDLGCGDDVTHWAERLLPELLERLPG